MGNQPWEEKVDDTVEKVHKRRYQAEQLISTPVMTILFSVFIVIVAAIIFIMVYTSNGGSDKEKVTESFLNKPKTSQSTSTTTSETTDETSSSVKRNGNTIIVQAGEGAGQIAARAGISVETLEKLNPEHMTKGYWYADPGDVVYID